MSKILALLAVILLSKEIRANRESHLIITLVDDAEKYEEDNPTGYWVPLKRVNGVEFTLGDKESEGSRVLENYLLYFSPDPPHTCKISLKLVDITYVALRGAHLNKVFLLDGGIEESFASLVAEVPELHLPKNITIDFYANYIYYDYDDYD